jgi:hypothetical protein
VVRKNAIRHVANIPKFYSWSNLSSVHFWQTLGENSTIWDLEIGSGELLYISCTCMSSVWTLGTSRFSCSYSTWFECIFAQQIIEYLPYKIAFHALVCEYLTLPVIRTLTSMNLTLACQGQAINWLIRARSNWLFAVAVTQPWSCTYCISLCTFVFVCHVMCCFIGKVYKKNILCYQMLSGEE